MPPAKRALPAPAGAGRAGAPWGAWAGGVAVPAGNRAKREAAEINGGTSAWPGLPPARHFVISANDFAATPGRSPGSSRRLGTPENGFAGLRSHCLMSANRFATSRASFIIP